MQKSRIVLGAIVIVFWLTLFALPAPLPSPVGEGDFRGHWSASYLLAHGEQSNPENLLWVERELTNWQGDFTIVTLNPPWLFVMLIPFTWFSFVRAVWLWLLINIGLTFVGVTWLWYVMTEGDFRRFPIWVAWLVAFSFLPTLNTLISGQMGILVLTGLAGFIFFVSRRREFTAGLFLALTTVKPQLVYLTLPILFIDMFYRKKWYQLIGFAIAVLGLGSIALILRSNSVPLSLHFSIMQTELAVDLAYARSEIRSGATAIG